MTTTTSKDQPTTSRATLRAPFIVSSKRAYLHNGEEKYDVAMSPTRSHPSGETIEVPRGTVDLAFLSPELAANFELRQLIYIELTPEDIAPAPESPANQPLARSVTKACRTLAVLGAAVCEAYANGNPPEILSGKPERADSSALTKSADAEAPAKGNLLQQNVPHFRALDTAKPRKYTKTTHPELYTVWKGMLHRCFVKTSHDYHFTGGRGITVCKAWQSFTPFVDWALANGYEPGLALTRKNINGDFAPRNCRWRTKSEAAHNQRTTQLTWEQALQVIARYSVGGVTPEELAADYGVSPTAIRNALAKKLAGPRKQKTETSNQ